MLKKQVVSRKRVVDHGEVLTDDQEVNAMLDLVNQETLRRFLRSGFSVKSEPHQTLV